MFSLKFPQHFEVTYNFRKLVLFNYVKSINDKNNKIKNAALIFLQTFLRNSFEKPGNIFAQKYIKSPKKKTF